MEIKKAELTYKILQDWVRLIRSHKEQLSNQEDLLLILLDWHRTDEIIKIKNGEAKIV